MCVCVCVYLFVCVCERERVCVYLCLNHLHSLGADALQRLIHTQSSLTPHLLHDPVQEDEGTSPTHPSTAVDQQGWVQGGWVLFPDSPDEGDERHGIARHSMVWPGCVVHVCQL